MLVFFCTRSVGITPKEVSDLEVLLAIVVARLVGVIPLTPVAWLRSTPLSSACSQPWGPIPAWRWRPT